MPSAPSTAERQTRNTSCSITRLLCAAFLEVAERGVGRSDRTNGTWLAPSRRARRAEASAWSRVSHTPYPAVGASPSPRLLRARGNPFHRFDQRLGKPRLTTVEPVVVRVMVTSPFHRRIRPEQRPRTSCAGSTVPRRLDDDRRRGAIRERADTWRPIAPRGASMARRYFVSSPARRRCRLRCRAARPQRGRSRPGG